MRVVLKPGRPVVLVMPPGVREIRLEVEAADGGEGDLIPVFWQNGNPHGVDPAWDEALHQIGFTFVGIHARFFQNLVSPSQVASFLDACEGRGLKGMVVIASSSANRAHSAFVARWYGRTIPDYWDERFWEERYRAVRKVAQGVQEHPALWAVASGIGWEDELTPFKYDAYRKAFETGEPDLGIFFMRSMEALFWEAEVWAPVPYLPQVAPAPPWVLAGIYRGPKFADLKNLGIKLNDFTEEWGTRPFEQRQPLDPDDAFEFVRDQGRVAVLEHGRWPQGPEQDVELLKLARTLRPTALCLHQGFLDNAKAYYSHVAGGG